MSELDLAYLAGVVDSDGHITINESKRNGVYYHGAVVGITGTRDAPHVLASSIWGGNINTHKPSNPRHRLVYLWGKTGKGAATVISDLLPYLRVKREIALVALELQEHVLCGKGDDPYPWFGPDYDPVAHRRSLRTEIAALVQDRKSPLLEMSIA